MLDRRRKLRLTEKLAMHMAPMPHMAAGHSGRMHVQNARRLQAHANKLAHTLAADPHLPDWAEQKLVLATDYAQSICNYLTYGSRPKMPSSRKILIIKKMGL
jgi:hypothetical protein